MGMNMVMSYKVLLELLNSVWLIILYYVECIVLYIVIILINLNNNIV